MDPKRLTRRRSRYAKDELAERAAALALKLGVSLTLHSDGSVTIRGKLLDSAANDAAASEAKGEDDADEEIRRCMEAYAAKAAPARR